MMKLIKDEETLNQDILNGYESKVVYRSTFYESQPKLLKKRILTSLAKKTSRKKALSFIEKMR